MLKPFKLKVTVKEDCPEDQNLLTEIICGTHPYLEGEWTGEEWILCTVLSHEREALAEYEYLQKTGYFDIEYMDL